MPEQIILFDGYCSTCTRWGRIIESRDRGNKFRLVAQDSEDGEAFLQICPEKIRNFDSIFLFKNGKWFYKSGALIRIATGLPLPFPILSFCWFIPLPIRDFVYDIHAKYR
ncbi:MAG: DUF393 domain-containing protein [Euryarchaeota archaeon]|jgi:predicted DCC family thiol-disulfide oxidoreductase YuxK|nr:DUF393 domain-containing protein [Euryarchaeota archaeon]MBT3654121.1 DUF393 domain-containing protein [Euryarchaeota archaeon]MBT3757038.1 DUF393 domain-containing protein [Euryarchaeota archaeon]MBT4050429.1 DUF393 domain-containing protein [Euryarchaeota archaeon]MBT4346887.1 DUF393 domain-containing protein [Euryarchaeota archaeon]|tara:strand:- start:4506 stop:4835 length:330 start_codon:yes stop_codon:yes gene_type:complete